MEDRLLQEDSSVRSNEEPENDKRCDALSEKSAVESEIVEFDDDRHDVSEHTVPSDRLTIKCVAGSKGRRLLYPPFLKSRSRSKRQKQADPYNVRSGDGPSYSSDNPVSETLSGNCVDLTKNKGSSLSIVVSQLCGTPLGLVKPAVDSRNSRLLDTSAGVVKSDVNDSGIESSQLPATRETPSSFSLDAEKSPIVRKSRAGRKKTSDPPVQVTQAPSSSDLEGELKKQKFTSTKTAKIRPHECDICGAAFGRKWELKRHRWTHRPVVERPYKCDECGAMFSQTGNLQAHVWSHLGHKPFKCEECGVEFARKSDLKRHSNTHTGDKPFQCDLCGLWFAYLSNLKRHIRRHSERAHREVLFGGSD